MQEFNLILAADLYKYSQVHMCDEEQTLNISYLESRGGDFNYTLWFGLQYILKKYFAGVVFTTEKIDHAERILAKAFNNGEVFDRSKYDYIVENHGGRLPISISCVDEGTVVPTSNALMKIKNTDPKCAWLVKALETAILQVWYPCTVATNSFMSRVLVDNMHMKAGTFDELNSIIREITLNDFGLRGASSMETGGIGGMSHLVTFRGSDNPQGSLYAMEWYNTDEVYGLGVVATEHSDMTQKGRSGEVDMIERLLNKFPTGIVSCVLDGYDIKNAIENYICGKFKTRIMNRDGVFVVRPDSGDVIATLDYIINQLFKTFGYTLTEGGMKLLPSYIRIIQGDSINHNMIKKIFAWMELNDIAPENIIFGEGGALLQKVNRDSQKFAIKCCLNIINGVVYNVSKTPMEIGADGSYTQSFKTSKSGDLELVSTGDTINDYITVDLNTYKFKPNDIAVMNEVFLNGYVTREHTFETVRDLAISQIQQMIKYAK